MTIISNVGNVFAQPSGTQEPTDNTNGEAAETNETPQGTTETTQANTDNSSTTDGQTSSQSDDTTTSISAQGSNVESTTSQATQLSTPVTADAQTLVQARATTEVALNADQAEVLARQNAAAAQEAYKLQSILDTMQAPRDLTPLTVDQATPSEPTLDSDTSEMPV